MIKLSHSAIETYLTCPYQYNLKYNEKYRSTTVSSALFFGGAVGNTWQQMALAKKEVLTPEEQELIKIHPYDFLIKELSEININGTIHSLPTCPHLRYYKKDYDVNLLNEDDLSNIQKLRDEMGFYLADGVDQRPLGFNDFIDAYLAGNLDEDEYSFMNYHFYCSMLAKGKLMVDSYAKEILPRIKKVYDIEKEINLVCSDGGEDSLIGYIDMICDYELDAENALRLGRTECEVVKVLFDHKTSSAKYKKDKIKEDSQQLSFYDFAEQIGTVGYIVAVKDIKTPKVGKRKGETFAEIQVLIDTITDEIKEGFLQQAGDVLDSISCGSFDKNFDGCLKYGKRCDYYAMCREGASGEYLFKKQKYDII